MLLDANLLIEICRNIVLVLVAMSVGRCCKLPVVELRFGRVEWVTVDPGRSGSGLWSAVLVGS